jgi:hypothetical protein
MPKNAENHQNWRFLNCHQEIISWNNSMLFCIWGILDLLKTIKPSFFPYLLRLRRKTMSKVVKFQKMWKFSVFLLSTEWSLTPHFWR